MARIIADYTFSGPTREPILGYIKVVRPVVIVALYTRDDETFVFIERSDGCGAVFDVSPRDLKNLRVVE